jgi:hypothetical protein
MTPLSPSSADASTTPSDAPAASRPAPDTSAAPSSLPVQIVERFVASLSGPDGVSAGTAAALGALLTERASPSRDVMLRSVQEAVEAASNSTSRERQAPATLREGA